MAILREIQIRSRPRKVRAFELTLQEQANVKRALRAIYEQDGSWVPLAEKLGCCIEVVTKGAGKGYTSNSRPSPGLALRAAQAVGVPVEDMLSGKWPEQAATPLQRRKRT